MEELFEQDEKLHTIIEFVGNALIAEESKTQVINPPRMVQMFQAYRAIRSMADPDWKVNYSLHSPYISMGTIVVEAADFIFEKLGLLQQALNSASNMEIYPLANGKLKMNITFHGITKGMQQGR